MVPGPQETGHISAEEEVYDQYPLSEKDWYIFADDMTPMVRYLSGRLEHTLNRDQGSNHRHGGPDS